MRHQLLDGQAIDLLLNNAGIIGPRGQTIGNIDYEAWAEVLAVNTMGPMRVSEAFVEHVASSDRKLIVTLTSGMGSIADNTSGGSIVYRSSKAAVNMKAPVLVLHGVQDGVIPVEMGWRVYRAANEPKRIELFPQGTHDDLFDQGAWEKTQAFVDSLSGGR